MWWLLLACAPTPAVAPWAVSGPPPTVTIVEIDPLVAGLPARVRFSYAGMLRGTSVRLAANEGQLGRGPCSPIGQPCLDLVAPVSPSADAVLQHDSGETLLIVTVPQAPQVGLQLMAFLGGAGMTFPPLVTNTVADADRDGDGLLDTEEAALGTYLWDTDSDNDGANDDVEVRAGTDPLDPRSTPTEVCANGMDDDADGLADCDDADCFGTPGCDEICDDGLDNDADDHVDCEDEDCWGAGCRRTSSRITDGSFAYRRDGRSSHYASWWNTWFDGKFRLDARGTVATYDPSGAPAGACAWAINADILMGRSSYGVASWSQQMIGAPTFGPGCADTTGVEVVPRWYRRNRTPPVLWAANELIPARRPGFVIGSSTFAWAKFAHAKPPWSTSTVTTSPRPYGVKWITHWSRGTTWTGLDAVQPFVRGAPP